jgi:hypothetical protein
MNSLVRGATMTHSQKWFNPEYAMCNCVVYGLTNTINHNNIYDIKVNKIKAEYCVEPEYVLGPDCTIVTDVGSSGDSYVEIFVGTNDEKNNMINTLI